MSQNKLDGECLVNLLRESLREFTSQTDESVVNIPLIQALAGNETVRTEMHDFAHEVLNKMGQNNPCELATWLLVTGIQAGLRYREVNRGLDEFERLFAHEPVNVKENVR